MLTKEYIETANNVAKTLCDSNTFELVTVGNLLTTLLGERTSLLEQKVFCNECAKLVNQDEVGTGCECPNCANGMGGCHTEEQGHAAWAMAYIEKMLETVPAHSLLASQVFHSLRNELSHQQPKEQNPWPVGIMVSMDVSKGEEPEHRIFGRIYSVQQESEDEVTYLAIEDSRNFGPEKCKLTDEKIEVIKILADDYASKCAEFARRLAVKIPTDSMSPVAVDAGDARLKLHQALEAAHNIKE